MLPAPGSWISGPSYDTEPVAAESVKPGDRLAYDGRVIEVTVWPVPAAWYEYGEYVTGVEIETRDAGSSARWFLCRQPGDILHRVT